MGDAEPQLAVERDQRARVAAFSVSAGLLLFAGSLWSALIEAKNPTVGLLQGLAPALHGAASATIDPRTLQEQFMTNHQVTLILAALLSAVGAVAMSFPLRYLAAAERLRSPAPSPIVGYLARYAPIVMAVFLPAYELSLVIGAHSYLSGSARTAAAITASTGGPVRFGFAIIVTLAELAVAGAFVMVGLRSMRVGLLTRMMGIVAILSGVLFLVPLTPLPVVQALWLIFFGATLQQFGGRPLPEAWTVAEARPWPPSQSTRGQRRQPRPSRGSRAPAAVPEPAPP